MNLTRILEALRSGANPDEAQWAFKGSKSQSSTSKSTPYQQKEYRRLLDDSTSWLNDKQSSDQSYGVSDPVADLTSDQQSAISQQSEFGQGLTDLYSTLGVDALSASLEEYDPNNSGLQSAIDAANNRTQWQYDTTIAPQIRQGATSAGQYGSSRHGVAEGIASTNLQNTMADNASTMAYNDYQSYMNRQTQNLNNLSAITNGLTSGITAQYNAGALEQSQEQAEIQGELEKWAYEQGIDYNTLAQYKSLIEGDMGGTTKTTTSGGSSGGFGSALGTIGGMAAGSMFGSVGSSIGAQIGGSLGGSGGSSGSNNWPMILASGGYGGTGYGLGQRLF